MPASCGPTPTAVSTSVFLGRAVAALYHALRINGAYSLCAIVLLHGRGKMQAAPSLCAPALSDLMCVMPVYCQHSTAVWCNPSSDLYWLLGPQTLQALQTK